MATWGRAFSLSKEEWRGRKEGRERGHYKKKKQGTKKKIREFCSDKIFEDVPKQKRWKHQSKIKRKKYCFTICKATVNKIIEIATILLSAVSEPYW